MVLKLEDKKAIVAEVADHAAKALSAVAADYRGLTVAEMTQLRAKARKSGVFVRVVRNTLARRALQDTEFKCLQDVLRGPVFLAFSEKEPGAAAKLLKEATASFEKLNVVGIAIGGQLLDPKNLEAVAKLPTRDEAIAMLMSVMKAPISQFVRTLAEPTAKMVRTFAALQEKKAA
ncbi:MAG: 50S ribosomal protein L10 [Gammaproteobacteria bacterium]|nr:50S ribosomal protein L10 [Gammaproteobacteria bacterium]